MPSAYSIPPIYEKEIKAVVKAGYYSNRSEVVRDALRSFFESNAQLRLAAAVEMYDRGDVTLGKAAEVSGLNILEFKEVLRDRGMKIKVPAKDKKVLRKRMKDLSRVRGGKKKK